MVDASTLLKTVEADAACRGLDTEQFFPTASDDPATIPPACTACPVREQCLQVGLTPLGEFGIWGGTTEGQRRRMRRQTLRSRGVKAASPASPDSTHIRRAVRPGSKRAAVLAVFDELGVAGDVVQAHRLLSERGVVISIGYVRDLARERAHELSAEQVGHQVPDGWAA